VSTEAGQLQGPLTPALQLDLGSPHAASVCDRRLGLPELGGPMRVIATVEDPLAVRQILAAQRVAEPLGPSPPGGGSTMAT